jgi:predicted HTH domain antitoxin
MLHIGFDIDEGVLARMKLEPHQFARELRTAAAVKWYEQRAISQDLAAEIAGVSRGDFVEALSCYGVSPFRDTLDELTEAAERR